MFQAPANNIILSFKRKYIKNFTSILKLASIQNGATVDPADMVNVVADVVAVPNGVDDRHHYKGFSIKDIKPGDVAIVRYDVIYDMSFAGPDSEPVHKNEIYYKGKEFFSCSIDKLYAVVRDGKIRMQNGYVMVEEMAANPVILVSQELKKKLGTAVAKVAHIGKPLQGQERIDVERDDWVYYNPNKVTIYQVNSRPYGILRQSDILGKRIESYGEKNLN